MKKAIYTLLIAGIATVSCKKQPEAMFEVSDKTPLTNQTVEFTNNSIDGKTYEWDFGDGTTSSEMNPSHAYTEDGTYTVKLTAYSKKEKKSDSETMTIMVSKVFEDMSNEERMMGLWDYDKREQKRYEDGELQSVDTYVFAEDFDTHTMNFKEDNILEIRTDELINTKEWFMTNDTEGIFSFDEETAKILEITPTMFVFFTSDAYELAGTMHRDTTFYHLSF